MTPLAHGGTAGLVAELAITVAVGAAVLWAAWKSRRARDGEDEEGRP